MSVLKRTIKNSINRKSINGCTIRTVNDSLVVDIDTNSVPAEQLIVSGSRYEVSNNRLTIPFTKKDLNRLLRKNFKATLNIAGRSMTFDIPEENIDYKGEYISLDGKEYRTNEERLARFRSVSFKDGEIVFDCDVIPAGGPAAEIVLADMEYHVCSTAAEEDVLQLFALSAGERIPAVAECPADIKEGLRLSQKEDRILLIKQKTEKQDACQDSDIQNGLRNGAFLMEASHGGNGQNKDAVTVKITSLLMPVAGMKVRITDGGGEPAAVCHREYGKPLNKIEEKICIDKKTDPAELLADAEITYINGRKERGVISVKNGRETE